MVDFSQQVHNVRENSNYLYTCRSLIRIAKFTAFLNPYDFRNRKRQKETRWSSLTHKFLTLFFFEDQESCFIFPLCFSCKYNLFEKKNQISLVSLHAYKLNHYTKVYNTFWYPIIIFHQSPLFTAKSRAPGNPITYENSVFA